MGSTSRPSAAATTSRGPGSTRGATARPVRTRARTGH
jgi:hypothetical protein